MEKKYLNIDEAAEYLRLKRKTLYNFVWQKRIPYYKVGKRVLFKIEQLENWVEKHLVPELERLTKNKKINKIKRR